MNTYGQNMTPKKAQGFTMLEMIVVLVVIGVITVLASRSIGGANAAMRVSEAANQVQQVQRAVNDWAPRSGIYTGVSITDLIADGYLTPPNDNEGNAVAPTEMNPWGGGITVSSSASTQYTVTFNDVDEDEAAQFANKLVQIGDVTESTDEVTVTIGS